MTQDFHSLGEDDPSWREPRPRRRERPRRQRRRGRRRAGRRLRLQRDDPRATSAPPAPPAARGDLVGLPAHRPDRDDVDQHQHGGDHAGWPAAAPPPPPWRALRRPIQPRISAISRSRPPASAVMKPMPIHAGSRSPGCRPSRSASRPTAPPMRITNQRRQRHDQQRLAPTKRRSATAVARASRDGGRGGRDQAAEEHHGPEHVHRDREVDVAVADQGEDDHVRPPA